MIRLERPCWDCEIREAEPLERYCVECSSKSAWINDFYEQFKD